MLLQKDELHLPVPIGDDEEDPEEEHVYKYFLQDFVHLNLFLPSGS